MRTHFAIQSEGVNQIDTLLNVQAALKGEVIRIDDPAAFKVISSRELGTSAPLLELAKANRPAHSHLLPP